MPSAIRPLLGPVLMLSLLRSEEAQAAPERVEVVVGAEPGCKRAAERLVRRLGGDVGHRLPVVHGFSARGLDVALIDSGVLGAAALDGARKLVRGPHSSEDAYDPDLRGLDWGGGNGS